MALLHVAVIYMHAHLPVCVQEGALSLQSEQGDSGGEGKGCTRAGETTLITSVRQIYISLWAFLCFTGMVVIAGLFAAQRMQGEVRSMHTSAMLRQQHSSLGRGVGPRNSSSGGMSKDTAMLLTFLYASLAWAMSNGIVLNPRRVRRQGRQ